MILEVFLREIKAQLPNLNFTNRCHSLGIAPAVRSEIKADLFGPSSFGDRPPVLDAETEDVFDERLQKYSAEWLEIAPRELVRYSGSR
jgi:hypothetical protein